MIVRTHGALGANATIYLETPFEPQEEQHVKRPDL